MISPRNFAQKVYIPTSFQLLNELVKEYNSFEYKILDSKNINKLNSLKDEIYRLSKENPDYVFKLKIYNI